MCLFSSQRVRNLGVRASYERLADHSLRCLQLSLARPSQISAKVRILLCPPAFGTNGVWPFPRALVSTSPTARPLFSTKVRPRSPPQHCHRYACNRQTLFWQATDFYQVGRAVAALLSLPIKPEGSNEEACLENFKNEVVYVNSFTVSQRDMLESALRVTGTKENNWTITKESAQERYSSGIKEIQEGKHIGFAKMITRVFYPDGCGDFEHNKGTLNSLLDLPKEDIDEATKVALDRSKASSWVG